MIIVFAVFPVTDITCLTMTIQSLMVIFHVYLAQPRFHILGGCPVSLLVLSQYLFMVEVLTRLGHYCPFSL